MKRRDFIKGTATGIAGSAISLKQSYSDLQFDIFSGNKDKQENSRKLLLPPAVREGTTIGITAPASPTSPWEIRHSVRMFKRMGFKVIVGDTIEKRKSSARYLSAPDEERADEFMNFVNDPEVGCILCGRGGYGSMRILSMIDYDAIRRNPKPIVGFSDITALLNAIFRKTNLVTFHGPVAIIDFNSFTKKHFFEILYEKQLKSPIEVKYPQAETLIPGSAMGKLAGGNLSMLISTLGTEYEIDTDGSIFFIEEVSEHAYKIDRMLTQLILAGKFKNVKAVIFGYFKGLNSRRPFYPGGSFTIKEVLENRIKPLGIPSVIGMPIGHTSNKLTVPIGINAFVDTEKKMFNILEQAVKS